MCVFQVGWKYAITETFSYSSPTCHIRECVQITEWANGYRTIRFSGKGVTTIAYKIEKRPHGTGFLEYAVHEKEKFSVGYAAPVVDNVFKTIRSPQRKKGERK